MLGRAHLAGDDPGPVGGGMEANRVPEGGILFSSTPCSMWSHPSAMTPRCPVLTEVLRSDPACSTTDHQQSHRTSPQCQGHRKPVRPTGVNWRALLKAAAFTPAGLWLRASAATDHALFSAPCSRNTQIKLDTSHTLGEQLILAQELISPKNTHLAQHRQHCIPLLRYGDMIQP